MLTGHGPIIERLPVYTTLYIEDIIGLRLIVFRPESLRNCQSHRESSGTSEDDVFLFVDAT